MYSFQLSSSLGHDLFMKSLGNNNKILKIRQHWETRWISRYKGVYFFKMRLKCITRIRTLKMCNLSKKLKEAVEAQGLFRQFATFNNLVVLFCLDDLLLHIKSLSVYLTTKSIDLSECLSLIEFTEDQIKIMKTEIKFNDLYEKFCR